MCIVYVCSDLHKIKTVQFKFKYTTYTYLKVWESDQR